MSKSATKLMLLCKEAIDRVKDYQSFASDSASLSVQLNAHRVRLERWGRSVGLDNGQLSAEHDPLLDDDQTRSMVGSLLTIINSTLGSDGRQYQARGVPTNLDATLGNINQLRTLDGVGSRRRKLTWALGGKGDRTMQITQLGKLVQHLHDLVPPGRVATTPPTTDLGSLDAFRGAGPLGTTPRPGTQSEHVWLAEIRQTMAEYRQALAEVQAETRREVHAWLLGRPSPNERYDESRNKRLPGTCDWILSRPIFARWSAAGADLPPGSPELLWIYGPPGFGKTILCTRIVEHLLAVPGNTVAHFFFSSDHESRRDPCAAIRSWVSQLASHPEAYALVRQRWETTLDHVATRATVVQLLHEVLQARPGCYLVVDGLDECTAPADDSSSVARFLKDVKGAITSTTRVVVVSREETEIRQSLRAGDFARVVEYQISPEDVSADAATCARDIADRKLPSKDEDVRASLSRTMADRCEGQFLWLKMQEPSLKTWKNLGQLQKVLDSTPKGLDRVYQRNWEKITRSDQGDRAVALLRWSAFALRPLTISEMTEAVLIDEDHEDLPADELPDAVDDDYIRSEILEVCGPLLESRQTWQYGASTEGSPFQAILRDYSAASWHAHAKSGVSLDGDLGTLERVRIFMNEAHPCWKPWRMWFDKHDDDERKQAEDGDIPPGPSYYALKLDLSAVAISHIKEFGPGPLTASGRRSVLDLCCLQGNIQAAEAILDAGVDVETRGIMGRTPLYTASHSGWAELAGLLLDRGAEMGAADQDRVTPILAAAANGHLEVVKFLVDRGADITVADDTGLTPVLAAAANGHLEVVKFLVDRGADITVANDTELTPVLAAAAKGHLEVVKFLVDRGADITVANSNGWTPVNSAAEKGHLEVVKFLVDKGADITVADNAGWTPLNSAASNGHLEVVKFLVDRGADITVANNAGWTPLNSAAANGHLEVVKFLVDRGADITVANNAGWTPVLAAAADSHLEVVKFLVDRGADITVANNAGRTPVLAAAANSHLEVVKFLVDKGADITVADSIGWTPMLAAAYGGYLEIVRKLEAVPGSDVTRTDHLGRSALFFSARRGHVHVVEYLLSNDRMDPSSVDCAGLV
ncbi:uncharacterized protein J7T54_002844 [Emericellopsis cladophorae]|uniref:Uncharacterized protein n=1 Tax=Emericellopsis cladophorae TaxID=2686198 RepID=A0A9P9XU12_9HYPO|nr:uncharacterized protein J7T54_002844 [Emericellopsis cladophorae]KAI6777808.1 hypothetical protein J7T54_002844 [Emericellopsis cladophorae]